MQEARNGDGGPSLEKFSSSYTFEMSEAASLQIRWELYSSFYVKSNPTALFN